jgi:predicted DCC family thiol-disulfide oxidoreductase YuxK
MQQIHLVDEHVTVHRGAAAGREVLRRLPLGWLWTLPFRVPGALPVAERIYVWITHRWGPLPRTADPTSQCDPDHHPAA